MKAVPRTLTCTMVERPAGAAGALGAGGRYQPRNRPDRATMAKRKPAGISQPEWRWISSLSPVLPITGDLNTGDGVGPPRPGRVAQFLRRVTRKHQFASYRYMSHITKAGA